MEPVMSAFQLYLTSSLNQSRLFLKLLMLLDATTESRRLFQVWITLIRKETQRKLYNTVWYTDHWSFSLNLMYGNPNQP